MKYVQKLLSATILFSLIAVAVVIRGPLEIFAGNTKDFLFTVGDFFPVMVVSAVLLVGIGSALVVLLPDKLFLVASVLLFWLGVAFWVQDLFLNTKLSETNGGPMDWSALGSLPLINAVIWLILLGAMALLCVFARKSWLSMIQLISGGLCLVQLVACVTVLFTAPAKSDRVQVLSGADQMKLGHGENMVVLVLDTIATTPIKSMLEQYPEAASVLKDFTLYDNACSTYMPTYPSVTHYLTGYELEFGTTAKEWMQKAWSSERCNRFYEKLHEGGYTCRIFADATEYVYGGVENLEEKFENTAWDTLRADKTALAKKLLKLSLYRCAPYICKPRFEVLTSDFDQVVSSGDVPFCTTDNVQFYQRLLDEKLSVDPNVEKLFVYEHLLGAHPAYTIGAQANSVPPGTVSEAECLRGLFVILEEYLNQMKELGVYDRSAIIIMADHGSDENLSPAFYVKRPGESHEQTPLNSAPLDYGDLQATVLELIGQNDGSFGPSAFDLEPGAQRRRVLWKYGNDDSQPPVQGSNANLHVGYIYYRDEAELLEHYYNDEPDYAERSNAWVDAPVSDLWNGR